MQSSPKLRIVAIAIYAAALCALQLLIVESGLAPNQNSIWLYNGLAGLLFGSRLLNPYFTPPSGAATNGFAASMSAIAASLAVTAGTLDAYILIATGVFSAAVMFGALAVLLARPPMGTAQPLWVQALDRAVQKLGSPHVIFTLVILVATWLFHRTRPGEVFAIVTVWAVITLLRPVESIAEYLGWIRLHAKPGFKEPIVGPVAAYQAPNIALIRQSSGPPVQMGATLLVASEQATWMLGVALNYVGRDEGNLLRALTAPLPTQLSKFAQGRPVGPGSGAALSLVIPEAEVPDIAALEWINRLCGIVDSDTTFEALRFEVINEKGLQEGRLVEARIAEERSVLFQLVEGITHEEIVQQKNKYGYARATARKIGAWDEAEERFRHVPWLPRINSPVFLVDEAAFEPSADKIGHFPGTSYGVGLDISSAVTHNTAILGILGIGKTYLSAELVERMIAAEVKVVCLDLTNQYATLLSDYIDEAHQAGLNRDLEAASAGGQPNRNRELGGSKVAFRQKVSEHLRDFLATPDRHILIFNPSQFAVTKQLGGMFQNDAELGTLTPSEITSIFSDCALMVCQELGMTDRARMCLVYEEAHSLVPEWNSVAADGDKTATAVSARAILQGRKYGLGCLLITQRTANVTKTILNQCNTILAMRTFDDTGKEFLSNYIGAEYASVLPSLEARHAVVFGKASSCENPVLLRLNDRDGFVHAFRAAHPPGRLPPAAPPADPGQPPAPLDDPVPF